MNSPFPAPPPVNRLNELRVGMTAVKLAGRLPVLRKAPTGNGRAVFLFPGYGTNDAVMVPLRGFLAGRGHDAKGWGLGTNNGDMVRLLRLVERLVRDEFEQMGEPVNLVGWSLGGVLARELARDLPSMVNKVATFGTPLFGPRHFGSPDAFPEPQVTAIEAMIRARQSRPITRPLTTIYSRNDGIVHWTMSVDDESPNNHNVEVSSSHIGMGIDPDVWSILATFFAEE